METLTNFLLNAVPAAYLLWILILVLVCSVLDEYLPHATATSPTWYISLRKVISLIDNPAIIAVLEKRVPAPIIIPPGSTVVQTPPAPQPQNQVTIVQPISPNQAGFSRLGPLSILTFLGLAGLALLVACTMPATDPATGATTTVPWTPAQTAWFELKAATAAENEAAAIKAQPGLSPLVIDQITTGMVATSNGVQAAAATLIQGGTVTGQITAAASQAGLSAINALGATLTAAHGSTADVTALAIAASVPALGQVVALAAATLQLRAGFIPTAADLAAATDALNAAAAR